MPRNVPGVEFYDCAASAEESCSIGFDLLLKSRLKTILTALWAGAALLASSASAAIRLDVFVGYDGIVTQGGFFPVMFEVSNDGPTFNAVIELIPAQFSQGQIRQVP